MRILIRINIRILHVVTSADPQVRTSTLYPRPAQGPVNLPVVVNVPVLLDGDNNNNNDSSSSEDESDNRMTDSVIAPPSF